MNFLTKFFRIDPNMSLPEKEETIFKLKERGTSLSLLCWFLLICQFILDRSFENLSHVGGFVSIAYVSVFGFGLMAAGSIGLYVISKEIYLKRTLR